MTQDDVIRLAKEAGWTGIYSQWVSPTEREHLTVPVTMEQIQAFAKLVAEKAFNDGYEKGKAGFMEAVKLEREQCAKVCEEDFGSGALNLADAIRARGQA